MKIIDTHSHLNDGRFKNDIDEVVKRALSAGVVKVYNNADSLPSFDDILSLQKRYPTFFRSVLGIHPEFANKDDNYFLKAYQRIKDNLSTISAIGEIGLDYHYDKSPETKERQKKVFIEQIRLAKSLSLPIIIHSRDADFDTLNIIKEEKPNKIDLHCFSGSYEIYKEYMKLPIQVYFGIGGVVTFKNSRVLKEIVEKGDIRHFLTETDAPYLAPTPYRGQRNEPSLIPYVLETISELKNLSLEETYDIIFENGENFYGQE